MSTSSQKSPQVLTPYLTIRGAARAIEFYQRVFGAKETMRLAEPGGRIGHAELEIAGAALMISDEYPEMGVRSPESIGGSPVGLHLYVPDVDAVFDRAIAAGAKAERPPADQFYGDRSGTLIDPFGHRWFVATRKEVLSSEQVAKRYEEMMKK
jgi:PhnB protein